VVVALAAASGGAVGVGGARLRGAVKARHGLFPAAIGHEADPALGHGRCACID
jgi:hypothetical protein